MMIPQMNPRASYLALKEEIDAAVLRVLESGWYLESDEVRTFEAEFAAWNHLPHVIGVGNGTDAIELALRTLDIGRDDEVIAPAHTATATIAAIELAGATPVLVDIDPHTYTLDPAKLSEALTTRTRAIIPVHLYGHPVDMDAVLEFARVHDLKVIEDCAQAHDAQYRGKIVGSMAELAAFSFYPTKNLGALGDGGALGCSDASTAQRARAIAQYGWHERYISEEAGMNTRLDALQAAILRCKLAVLDENTQRRIEIAEKYTNALKDKVHVPVVRDGCRHVYHLYVIRHPERDALREHLKTQNVSTAVHYPLPNHLHPAYRGRLGDVGSFPVYEQISNDILSLPLFPELTDDQVEYVIEAVLAFPS